MHSLINLRVQKKKKKLGGKKSAWYEISEGSKQSW